MDLISAAKVWVLNPILQRVLGWSLRFLLRRKGLAMYGGLTIAALRTDCEPQARETLKSALRFLECADEKGFLRVKAHFDYVLDTQLNGPCFRGIVAERICAVDLERIRTQASSPDEISYAVSEAFLRSAFEAMLNKKRVYRTPYNAKRLDELCERDLLRFSHSVRQWQAIVKDVLT